MWVSALVSSFIDNIPFTTAMVSRFFVFSLSLPQFPHLLYLLASCLHLPPSPRCKHTSLVSMTSLFPDLARVPRTCACFSRETAGRMFRLSRFSLQIPVVLELNQKNKIDLHPLVWALAMGSCLGGEAQTRYHLYQRTDFVHRPSYEVIYQTRAETHKELKILWVSDTRDSVLSGCLNRV